MVLIVLADQFLKYVSLKKNLPDWEIFLNTVCNPNLSLSLALNPVFFWFSWFLALIFLLFLIYKFKNFFLLLVLAGTLSNLIDRLTFGCVIDYISILNFPIFNLADFFISFGFVGFILFSNFKK
jgi:signal peptidase II